MYAAHGVGDLAVALSVRLLSGGDVFDELEHYCEHGLIKQQEPGRLVALKGRDLDRAMLPLRVKAAEVYGVSDDIMAQRMGWPRGDTSYSKHEGVIVD